MAIARLVKPTSWLTTCPIFFWLLSGCVTVAEQAQSVQVLTDVAIPGASAYSASLVLSAADGPLVAYFSSGPSHAIRYWRFGSEVETVGLAGDERRDAVSLSLALAPDGTPGVAYVDDRNGDLIYAERRGTEWRAETVDADGETGYFPSLAYDPQGRPHISYFDNTNNDVKYAVRGTGGWRIETIDASGGPGFHIPAGFTRLALGCAPSADDCAISRPRVAYLAYRYKPYDGELRYAARHDWGWHIETVDSATAAGGFPSLALERGGQPWISYYRVSTWDFDEGELRVAHHDGGRWRVESVDAEGNAGRSNAIGLTSGGQPMVAYYAAAPGDLRLAWRDGRWRRQPLLTEGNIGYRVTLAIGGDDVIHLAFVDGDAGNTHYMMVRIQDP